MKEAVDDKDSGNEAVAAKLNPLASIKRYLDMNFDSGA